MEPEYSALQVFLDPADFGHCGIRRRRTFIFLQHCETCVYLALFHHGLYFFHGIKLQGFSYWTKNSLMLTMRLISWILREQSDRYLFDIFQAFDTISKQIRKIVNTRPSDYMVSNEQARKLDMMQFTSSRKIPFQPDTCFDIQYVFCGLAEASTKSKSQEFIRVAIWQSNTAMEILIYT